MQQQARVLIAFEDNSIRRLLELELQEAGFVVLSTSSAQHALQQALAENPDMIVLDRYLTGMPSSEIMLRLAGEKRAARLLITCDRTRAECSRAVCRKASGRLRRRCAEGGAAWRRPIAAIRAVSRRRSAPRKVGAVSAPEHEQALDHARPVDADGRGDRTEAGGR